MSNATEASIADEIIRLEHARARAFEAVDREALQKINGEDLVYIHSNGTVDSKATLLPKLFSGRSVYKKITFSNLKVRVYGEDIAIVSGDAVFDLVAAGVAKTNVLRFTDAWKKTPDGWVSVHWHSSKQS